MCSGIPEKIELTGNLVIGFCNEQVLHEMTKMRLGVAPVSTQTDWRLAVCGTVSVMKVKVTSTWCDYVFADNYQLTPLIKLIPILKSINTCLKFHPL